MEPVSITEAVRLTGKSRATLYRMINKGKLSATQAGSGEKLLDIAELIRVFGELQGVDDGDESHKVRLKKHHETHAEAGQKQSQSEQIRHLKDQLAFLQNEFVEMRKREDKLIAILDRKLLPAPDYQSEMEPKKKKKKSKKKKKKK